MKRVIWLGSSFLILATHAIAQSPDPVTGYWKTIDDDTQRETSIVKLEIINQRLQGVVVKMLVDPPDSVCEKCTDYRKNQPILGMKIMEGLTQTKPGFWSGGEILDPDNGKTYRVQLNARGDKLFVKGYIGISLFGREQVWIRAAGL
jgi:uncharacterized protein (DUF2147 family)